MKTLIAHLDWYIYKDAKIVACCCGHGKYPMTILVRGKLVNPNTVFINPFKKNTIIDICSNKLIPRKRRFYKRDKEGYYYIPETLR